MKTRTNEQVIKMVLSTLRKYSDDQEKIADALMRYWLRYDLTLDQTFFLDEVKKNGRRFDAAKMMFS